MENKKTATKKQRPDFRHNILLNLILAVLLVLILIFASYWAFDAITAHGKEFKTPDLTYMTVEDADRVAAHDGLELIVLDSLYIHSLPRGVVYQQDPVPGSMVKKGRKVRVVINSVLPKKVEMPDLVGYSLRQAKGVLESRGLILGKLIYVDDIATNNVLDQQCNHLYVEPGSFVESESVIDLVLGLDPSENSTYIPDVIGLSRKAAMNEIYGNSLNPARPVYDKTVHSYSDSLNAKVWKQAPAPSDFPVSLGQDVTVYLTLDDSKIPTPQPQPKETK